MEDFRELRVWQLGMELAEETYRLSQHFPKHEVYGLGSQIQRSAVSIPANIAEGRATGSTKTFLRHLAIAQGSLAELQTHLMVAERIRYGNGEQTKPILERCTQEARMLRSLRNRLRRRIA
ncbi:MAG: four helix bundle protein [Pirellulales bacterium]|nr:four helix bundle protein [Pirellulales bacterium]